MTPKHQDLKTKITSFFKEHGVQVFTSRELTLAPYFISTFTSYDLRITVILGENDLYTFKAADRQYQDLFIITSPSFTLAKVAINVFLTNYKGETK